MEIYTFLVQWSLMSATWFESVMSFSRHEQSHNPLLRSAVQKWQISPWQISPGSKLQIAPRAPMGKRGKLLEEEKLMPQIEQLTSLQRLNLYQDHRQQSLEGGWLSQLKSLKCLEVVNGKVEHWALGSFLISHLAELPGLQSLTIPAVRASSKTLCSMYCQELPIL